MRSAISAACLFQGILDFGDQRFRAGHGNPVAVCQCPAVHIIFRNADGAFIPAVFKRAEPDAFSESVDDIGILVPIGVPEECLKLTGS